jgi:hypothetical protein
MESRPSLGLFRIAIARCKHFFNRLDCDVFILACHFHVKSHAQDTAQEQNAQNEGFFPAPQTRTAISFASSSSVG